MVFLYYDNIILADHAHDSRVVAAKNNEEEAG